MSALELSIVIPVYRSSQTLAQLCEQLLVELNGRAIEIIFVHDAGDDASWDAITALCDSDVRIKGLNLRRNSGQHNAIMAGLRAAVGSVVITMDDDLQHSPSDVPELVSAVERGADVCYAIFEQRQHTAWKKIGSGVNNLVATILLSKPRALYLSPFRAIKSDVVREITKYCGPSVYIDGLILGVTARIAVVRVAHHPRLAGTGGYTFRRSVSLFLRMATMGSVAPLRLATLLGFSSAFFGALLGIFLTISYLLGNQVPTGWTSLAVLTLWMSGIQLVSLGLVGEYIGKLLLEARNTPQYTIAETRNL